MWLDQYYTKSEILQKLSKIAAKYLKKDDIATYVDFSCGTNQFAQNIKEIININTLSYDVCPPKNVYGNVIKTDFLKLKPSKKSISQPIAVGLNPPYGPKHTYIELFIDKSISLYKPTLFILIIPFVTMKNLSKSMNLLYYSVLPLDAFYVDDKTSFKYPTCFCILSTKGKSNMKTMKMSEPKGYQISTSLDPSFADLIIRSSGRHAGRDMICRCVNGFVFLRYDGNIEVKKNLHYFTSYRDGTKLNFKIHWMKIKYNDYNAKSNVKAVIKFLTTLRDRIKDPERDLKSPPAIRKEYIIRAVNSFIK
jgi:hypothetical protein